MWRLRSLRGRLVAGLLAVAALGLAVAGFGTYRALAGFLESRVDQQLRDSKFPVYGELAIGDFPGGRRRASGDAVIITGTFAELRHPNGAAAQYITRGRVAPVLEHTEQITEEHYYTAPSESGDGEYRVLATPLDDGSVLSVALPLDDNEATLRRLVGIELVVSAAVLAALAAMGWWVVRLSLRPLDHFADTAQEISAGDLSRRVDGADERTEVGRLGLALNRMMARIESAFDERRASEERLRRFVGDASHELRTPITSIRGYAELFRRGAADRPEDLATAMRRIEEESARMGVLVEDLLLLARLDQGRPLDRSPVDLTRLAADAVDDARVASPDRQFDLADGSPVIVRGDEARLRQVVANLVSNARTHTPPGTAVRVSVVAAGDRARMEVSDDGPGLAPDAADKVFQRFFRVDKARNRSTGGAGLGLSIVAAITAAHGGSTTLEPVAEGARGTTFVVDLPLGLDGDPVGDPVGEEPGSI